MLSEIHATFQAFGDALLADHLTAIEMNTARSCCSTTPYSIVFKSVTACRKAVEDIREQRNAIEAGLNTLDSIYSENERWDTRVGDFLRDMSEAFDPKEVLSLFKHDESFASGFSDENGYSPFMWACYNGHHDLVNHMLDAWDAVRLADTLYVDGQTALLMAIENGHTEIARDLIRWGADVFQGRKDGYTPLMAAAEFGHTELVKTILWQAQYDTADDGDTKEYVNRSGGGGGKMHWSQTALMWAIGSHHIDTAQVIANSPFCEVRTVAKCGYNALIVAASCYNNNQNDLDLFSTLIAGTPDLEHSITTTSTSIIFGHNYSMLGHTALLYACDTGSAHKVEQLLNAGADPNHGVCQITSTRYSYTPLMVAHGHYHITRLLLKAGADATREFKLHDGQMKRALDFAAFGEENSETLAELGGYDLIDLAENIQARRPLPPLPRSRCSSIGDVSDDDMPALVHLA
jgi:ankyrin repeat protein